MTLTELGNIIRDNYKEQVKSNNKIASGGLYNITAEVEISNGHYMVFLNLPDYWKYVEYGRNPGKFPPIDAIRKWIEIKPLVPDSRGGKVPTTDQLAYLVARKIARDGIEPTPLLENTLNDDSVNKAIDKFTENLITDIYKIIKDF